MIQRGTTPNEFRSDTASPRRRASWYVLLAICLCVVPARVFARHHSGDWFIVQDALTPLQLTVEAERARLSSDDSEVRRDAVLRLGAIARPESARAAGIALNDSSPAVRATAAHAVSALPAAEAAALILPLLRDRSEFVRQEGAYALGAVLARIAVVPLVSALERDKSAGVRGAAAVALGQIGDVSAVSALAETLARRVPRSGFLNRITRRRTEENEFVRRSAARSLGEIGDARAVPALISVLNDERSADDLRREAARALGLIKDPAAVPALRGVLNARDPYLGVIALEALRRIENRVGTPLGHSLVGGQSVHQGRRE
ncbi:MAG: HEAT repeat domain-containing protein [Pyrinomonadaceae bacterium]|nr:HEAT repeat domain-containing protein [Pyrinomonadaceae bacterium]